MKIFNLTKNKISSGFYKIPLKTNLEIIKSQVMKNKKNKEKKIQED